MVCGFLSDGGTPLTPWIVGSAAGGRCGSGVDGSNAKAFNTPMPLRLEVSIATQRLSLWNGSRVIKEWPVSTAKAGVGFKEGSLRTPLGQFRIKEKIGGSAPHGTIFKARQPTGVWQGEQVADDLILTRILRLDGLEPRNANTWDRYVYIHGTNDEPGIGRPGSHGCVRLRNADIVELYDLVPEGAEVWIGE